MAQFKRKSAGAIYTANASFTWTISGIALIACGGADTLAGGEGGDVFAISHIASDIENACVITDFSMDDND